MKRITGDGHLKHRFSSGNPRVRPPIKATVMTPKWCNSVQDEILSVILKAGESPTGDLQLKNALVSQIATRTSSIETSSQSSLKEKADILSTKIEQNASDIKPIEAKEAENKPNIGALNTRVDALAEIMSKIIG